MRLIDADALKPDYFVSSTTTHTANFYYVSMAQIAQAPTIRPSEFDGYADGYPVYYEWKCSNCGCIVEDEKPTWNFCPNCGTVMDREGEEE